MSDRMPKDKQRSIVINSKMDQIVNKFIKDLATGESLGGAYPYINEDGLVDETKFLLMLHPSIDGSPYRGGSDTVCLCDINGSIIESNINGYTYKGDEINPAVDDDESYSICDALYNACNAKGTYETTNGTSYSSDELRNLANIEAGAAAVSSVLNQDIINGTDETNKFVSNLLNQDEVLDYIDEHVSYYREVNTSKDINMDDIEISE